MRHTLSTRASELGTKTVSARLSLAATAAERARESWLAAARMWELVTTETRGRTSPVAVETADLALWSGRLAFADSAWSLAQGPARPWRPGESLSPRLGDLPAVVAAAHQACDASSSPPATRNKYAARPGQDSGTPPPGPSPKTSASRRTEAH